MESSNIEPDETESTELAPSLETNQDATSTDELNAIVRLGRVSAYGPSLDGSFYD